MFNFCFEFYNDFVKKIILIFAVLSVFSASIFSQPGGGHGPGGGPSAGLGTGPGASGLGGRGSPSSSHSAPPSVNGLPPSHKSSTPPAAIPDFKGSGSGSRQSSSASGSAYQVINFSGMRKYSVPEALEVSATEILTHKNGINFVIHFNQSVDAANLNVNSIFINGKNPESDVKIKFNRRADSVTLLMGDGSISEDELKNASVIINDVQTFDGKYVKELIVK